MKKKARISVHLSNGRTIDGVYKRTDRKYLIITEHALEVDGVMRGLESESLLIPRSLIELIEVHK